ncbi:Hypothetical protein (Fragment) [Durusdinium trenchii]|uniref:Uncharacterized protein n=1 Tax=Durusdinium trenchii TaxID=1381693 RepID=A0ABP0HT68_9DINO
MALKIALLVSSTVAAVAITLKEAQVQDSVAFAAANETLGGYVACNRPHAWCSTNDNSHTYLHEDCNGDGLLDQVCYWKGHVWMRLSGHCEALNNGHKTNPKCDKIKEMAEDAQKYIYITGTDHNIYRQPLAGLSPSTNWELVGSPAVISLISAKDYFIGVGTDKKLYGQPFSLLKTMSKWVKAPLARGDILDGDTVDDTFYGVGTNGLIYSQSISGMHASSHWSQATSSGHVSSIAIHPGSNFLYGANRDGAIYKIPANNLGANGWLLVQDKADCFHISISGDDIYCRTAAKEINHQKVSTLTASSTWTKIAKGAAVSVMVPQVTLCQGELLSEQDDDFACDKITSAEKCAKRYERSGKSDVYLQCVPSAAGKGSAIINCLAREHCVPR